MKQFLRTIVKLLLIGIFGGILFSCTGGMPISTVAPHNNETYKVEYLFEHDGCKVYRFMDRGNSIYFTNCRGTVSCVENDSARTITQVETWRE